MGKTPFRGTVALPSSLEEYPEQGGLSVGQRESGERPLQWEGGAEGEFQAECLSGAKGTTGGGPVGPPRPTLFTKLKPNGT